jgi:phosphoserine phosphatase
MQGQRTARPTATADIETTAEQQASLRRFQQDAEYFERHHEELLARHAEEWVAIYGDEVVDTAPELADLLAALRERGVPAGQAFVEFVTSHREPLIL